MEDKSPAGFDLRHFCDLNVGTAVVLYFILALLLCLYDRA